MVTPFSDPPLDPLPYRICQAFQILLQSEAPTYLNSDPEEKLQSPHWLISATPPEFNHLRGPDKPYTPTSASLVSYSTI